MSYKLPNKISLEKWWEELEEIMPTIREEAGYMKHVPLNAIKFSKWAYRAQDVCQKHYAKHGSLSFTVFDVETTGLSNARKFLEGLDGITDIAGLKIINGEYLGNKVWKDGHQEEFKNEFEYQTLVNPGVSIPDNVAEITNITNEMVQKDGIPQYLAVRAFKKFTEDTILVGHNIGDSLQNKNGYDISTVLGPIYNRYFNQNVEPILEQAIDTLPMFDGIVAGMPHTNENLAKMVGYELLGAHRAMPDVRVNAVAFHKLINLVLKLDVDELVRQAEHKLDNKNFILTYLRTGADFNISKTDWVEFGLKLDKKYNVGRRRSQAIIKYDPYADQFMYEDIYLPNGEVITKEQAKVAMPEHVLRRQARILTRTKNFTEAIQPFHNVVF